MLGKDWQKTNVLRRWWKTGRDRDDWTSNGSRGAMQRLEMCVNWRLWAGMVEPSIDVMMTSEVGDDQAGQQHKQDHSGMVAWDHAAHEMPWRRPWSRLIEVDAANIELQGRPIHDRNDLGATSDEPQRWEQTGGAAVSTLEARPGQSCRSRVLSAQVTPPGNGSSRRWRIDKGDKAGGVWRNSMTQFAKHE